MEEVKRLLRILKNKLLLRLSFVMVNKHGFSVYLKDGRQIKSNTNRKTDYSMDDESWCTLNKSFKENPQRMYNGVWF